MRRAQVNPPDAPEMLFAPQAAAQIRFGIARQEVILGQAGGVWRPAVTCDEDMYQREIADFARAILDDRPPLAGAADGIAALQVALAALESARTGKAVRLRGGEEVGALQARVQGGLPS
jgi:predicted dehydrogenase